MQRKKSQKCIQRKFGKEERDGQRKIYLNVRFKGRNKKGKKVGERSVIVLKVSSKPRH